VGVSSRNFFQTCREAEVIIWVQLLKGPPPKFWEGQKTSKFRHDFWQLSTLIANISGNDQHIENRRKTRSTTTPSTLGEQNLVNIGQTNNRDPVVHIDPPKWIFFSGDYISALTGCFALKFLHVLEIHQGYLAHTPTGAPPPQKKKLIVKIKNRA